LQDGFPHSEPSFSDESHLDELIPVTKLDHVVDADSTQTQAIETVRQGKSLVVARRWDIRRDTALLACKYLFNLIGQRQLKVEF